MSKAPSMRMPNTITTEQSAARTTLYILVFIPIAFANVSSSVMANIWR